jgi:hypothetical protein
MTNFNPELLHLYPAIYLSFHNFSEPAGHFSGGTLVINSLDCLTKNASFLLFAKRFFRTPKSWSSTRQSVSLFETRASSDLAQIPDIACDPDAGVDGHCNHRLAKYVLAKERAHYAGNHPEQGKALQTRKQADQQKQQ